MTELSSIGANTDVPAGISVLEEEKLDMFGQYKRLRNEFTGILTGDFLWGFINKTGSYRVRNVYFAQSMLETKEVVLQVKQLLFLVPGTLLNILLKSNSIRR
jgi:glutamate dehydrogenase (NADP+)